MNSNTKLDYLVIKQLLLMDAGVRFCVSKTNIPHSSEMYTEIFRHNDLSTILFQDNIGKINLHYP